MNPFTDQPYSDQYDEIKKMWSKLPAWKQVDKIKKSIRDNPLTFIISGTGSGKTVITPMAAVQTSDYKGSIAVSLPKREVTRSVAQFASKTMDVELGKQIGYVFKGDRKLSDDTKLVYMTDGVLVSSFYKDPDIPQYDIVIIDEAHERKVQIDLILLFLKRLLLSKKRPDFRAVIMSATIDKAKYVNYFKGVKSNVIEITGQTNFPIEVKYLDNPVPSYVKTGIDIIKVIADRKERDDVLFFVTSGHEARQICKEINSDKVFCIEVYADMNPDLIVYAKEIDAFKDLGQYTRKVVIATNMAESSLTIKGLSVVIDSCYELFSYFDPSVYGKVLEKKLVTKAQAIQRRGRVGRTAPGVCFHLVTEKQFNELADYPEPDIIKNDVTVILLQMINMTGSYDNGIKMFNDLMDPPPKPFIQAADNLYKMYDLVIDNSITNLGVLVSKFGSIPINRSLFMIYAYQLHVLREASIIVAMIQETDGLDNLFIRNNRPKKLKVDKKSDHFTLLKVFESYLKAKDKDAWCKKYDVKRGMIRRAANASRRYFHQIGTAVKEDQARQVNVREKLLQALVTSHRHLTGRTGSVDASSVVDKKLLKGSYLYDSLSKVGGSWKISIITIT